MLEVLWQDKLLKSIQQLLGLLLAQIVGCGQPTLQMHMLITLLVEEEFLVASRRQKVVTIEESINRISASIEILS